MQTTPSKPRTCYSALRTSLPLPIRAAFVVSFLLPLSILGCINAPYRIGNDGLFPQDIQTVYVPMIESDSFRRNLGERLTEAVVKRIEATTPFKVVNSPNADSVLSGKLVSDTKRVLVENTLDDARDTEVNFQVVVTWANRKGDLIRQGNVNIPPSVDLGARADLVPEFGRSTATTQQEVIDKLATQIVGLMETPW